MTQPSTTRRPLHRPPVRSAVYSYSPKRLPRLTGLGIALLVVLILLVAGIGVAAVRAEDEPEGTPIAERFTPASRGDRVVATEAVQRWRPLLNQYAWDVEVAFRIVACESEGSPAVWNRQGSGAHGLFQLLGWEWLAYRLHGVWSVADPAINAHIAYLIWEAGGGRFDTSIGWHASVGCWG